MESKTYKYYCGLDIHKESYVGCILDKEDVEIRSHKFPAKKDALVSFLSGISDSECLVIVENCNLWRIAYTMLKNLGFCTFLVPASSARKETGLKKTDYYDAKALAELTRINHLKPLYIPKDIILSYRDLTHHLLRLRRTKVQYMNRIKAELLRSGINYPPKIWNKKGIFWLQSLANVQIKSLINLLLTIKSEEKKIEKEVEKIADSLETTKILQTIPGVGKFLSLLIYAETGEIVRFRKAKQFVMYSGLCLGIHQSANTSYAVKNWKSNRTLKWAFSIASGRAAMMQESKTRKKYFEIKEKNTVQTTRRVIARDMTIVVWNMLTYKQNYHH